MMNKQEIRNIIQEQFNSILNEGKYDLATGIVVDAIWRYIKDSKKEYDSDPIENDVVVYENPVRFKNITFDLQVIINRVKEEGFGFKVDGASDVDFINIKVDINPEYEEKLYNKTNSKLQDTVRHEIEHITQMKGGKSSKAQRPEITSPEIRELIQTDPSRIAEYFLLPDEIPAMVYGLYRQAKTEKKTLSDVFDEYLNYFVDVEQIITPQQKEEIIKAWTAYAKKNLPKAKYS